MYTQYEKIKGLDESFIKLKTAIKNNDKALAMENIAIIKNTDKFQPLFSNYPNGKAYYGYYKNLDTHITIVDLETIITDAEARNNVFLNILSKSRKSKESND